MGGVLSFAGGVSRSVGGNLKVGGFGRGGHASAEHLGGGAASEYRILQEDDETGVYK